MYMGTYVCIGSISVVGSLMFKRVRGRSSNLWRHFGVALFVLAAPSALLLLGIPQDLGLNHGKPSPSLHIYKFNIHYATREMINPSPLIVPSCTLQKKKKKKKCSFFSR